MRNNTVLLGEVGPAIAIAFARLGTVPHFDGLESCMRSNVNTSTRCLVVRSGIRIDAALLAHFPRLQHIIRAGNGVDNIDLEALERHHIVLHRNTTISAAAVAELALAAWGVLARRLPLGQEFLRRGEWRKSALMGESLAELRLAIWGAGPVGQACAEQAQPLCKDVIFASWPSNRADVKSASADVLEQTADCHIVCLPLRESTHHFFGRDRLARLAPQRPYFINVGRLALEDTPEVLAALARDELRGALIDPFDETEFRLLRHQLFDSMPRNLLLAPHLGAQRSDIQAALATWAVAVVNSLSHTSA